MEYGGRILVWLVITGVCSTLSFAAVPISVRQGGCGASCAFYFCGKPGTTYELDLPDSPITGPICRDGVLIGHVDSAGEALVDGVTPISQWTPTGLLQKFPSSFFKPYGIYTFDYEVSGIGHETPQRNQADFIPGHCYELPLVSYQVLNADYTVLNNFGGNPSDCISFSL